MGARARQEALARKEIPLSVQAVFEDPGARTPDQLERARIRAPKLHTRTIPLDGTPIFWGLAKPLVRARERGWGGRLTSADRRAGIPERFGKMSQASLFSCFTRSKAMGRCPSDCAGNCNPANPPGFSSHELRSDGSRGFPGKARGAKLKWFELGIDVRRLRRPAHSSAGTGLQGPPHLPGLDRRRPTTSTSPPAPGHCSPRSARMQSPRRSRRSRRCRRRRPAV